MSTVACSSKVQQPHCSGTATADAHAPAELFKQPSMTALPPDGKEVFRFEARRLVTTASLIPPPGTELAS
jgi:hypothetical protein